MFDLSPEQRNTRKRVRELANRELIGRAGPMDAAGSFDLALMVFLFGGGFMGMLVPGEYGGGGASVLEYVTAVEELARGDASTALVMSIHSSLVTALLLESASDEMKERYLPMLAGSSIGAFALTEEDPSAPTTATEYGASFAVTGTKMYITNGPIADIVVLFAITGKTETKKGGKTVVRDEVSAFLIETGKAEGLQRSSAGPRMGLSAAPVGRLSFDRVRVPKENLIGERGAGFKIAMRALDGGRIAAAAMGVGVAQAALDAAVKYARSRVTQSGPLAKLQAVQLMIAESATRLEAARALTYQAASLADRGEPITEMAAQAKLFAAETASFVASKALQVHGGAGVVRELHAVERYFRDARVLEIIEGTSEIQKLVVAGCELR